MGAVLPARALATLQAANVLVAGSTQLHGSLPGKQQWLRHMPGRTPRSPRKRNHARLDLTQHEEPEPPGLLEELAAKGLFCLLCVVETAVQLAAHATQVGRVSAALTAHFNVGQQTACRPGVAKNVSSPCQAITCMPATSPPLLTRSVGLAQMVRRAGMAGARLAQKLAAAARPALEGDQAAGAACAAALRRGDYRGAAKLAGQHASEAVARLVAGMAPVLAAIRDSVQGAAARWHAASPTCCCIPTASQLHERQQRLLASAKSSAAATSEWASAKWSAVDPAGKLPAAWKRARTSRSSTYVLVVVGLGCASLVVGTLLLTFM